MRLLIVRQTHDICLVRAHGAINQQSVKDLDSALTQIQGGGHTHVLLDLWDATFIDSVGLGVLLSARRRSHRALGGFAVVAEPNGRVQRVFELAGLTDTLPVYATRTLAASTLGGSAR